VATRQPRHHFGTRDKLEGWFEHQRLVPAAEGRYLAYQVVGEGPVDVVPPMNGGFAIDLIWEEPTIAASPLSTEDLVSKAALRYRFPRRPDGGALRQCSRAMTLRRVLASLDGDLWA
jgi:hypothetical protein